MLRQIVEDMNRKWKIARSRDAWFRLSEIRLRDVVVVNVKKRRMNRLIRRPMRKTFSKGGTLRVDRETLVL